MHELGSPRIHHRMTAPTLHLSNGDKRFTFAAKNFTSIHKHPTVRSTLGRHLPPIANNYVLWEWV
jgi:hypothetical protein